MRRTFLALLALLLAAPTAAPTAAQTPGQEWREGVRRVRVDDVTATHVHYTVLESEMTPATVGRSYKIQIQNFLGTFTTAALPAVRVDTVTIELPPRVDTLIIAVPCLCDTVMQPPDTLPTEPPDTVPTEPPDTVVSPPPDTTAATPDSTWVRYIKFGDAFTWDGLQDSVVLHVDSTGMAVDSAQACFYAWKDDAILHAEPVPPCPLPPPPHEPEDSIPTDPGLPPAETDVVFSDAFDGDVAPLEAHTPDVGAAWVAVQGTGIIQLSGGGTVHSSREGSATKLVSTPAPPGPLVVRWGLTRLSDANYNPAGILLRADSAGNGGYTIAYAPGGRRHVLRRADGVAVAVWTEPAIAVGETVEYALTVSDTDAGPTFVFWRNGNKVEEVHDTGATPISAGNFYGLQRPSTAYVTPTTGVHMTHLEVEGATP